LNRNSRIEADLIDQLFNSSEKRLARLLLLANFGKDSSPQPIGNHINPETLAEMIGTTRSRVSFFTNKFRKLGFIGYNGEIEVHHSLLNAVLQTQGGLACARRLETAFGAVWSRVVRSVREATVSAGAVNCHARSGH